MWHSSLLDKVMNPLINVNFQIKSDIFPFLFCFKLYFVYNCIVGRQQNIYKQLKTNNYENNDNKFKEKYFNTYFN